jgi:glutamate/tyrosine decarboxylase-like PLP-dependent enzyme
LAHASASLGLSASSLSQPLGTDGAIKHLLDDIVPALSGQSGPRYFGFVTGGVHPAATAADNIVTATDQNVQVHLPDATIATELEAVTLDMLADLLGLKDDVERAGGRRLFEGRTFTTGATASNVLGLACGRESVVARRLPDGSPSVGELGLLGACAAAGIRKIQVLTSAGHSSLSKAASIVGIGRASVVEMPCSKTKPWLLDLEAVEAELKAGSENGTATIIAISLGEVNTGRYAVDEWTEVKELSALSKKYGSWFHVDGGRSCSSLHALRDVR